MTRRFAVIGDPVRHSRSPRIHNAAYETLDLDAEYVARPTTAATLEAVLEDLRSGRLDGVNVTMPLKRAMAEACDQLDSVASRLRAVNTIDVIDGALHGSSTDGAGVLHAWSRGALPADAPVLVLGAGGAAAAAVDTLARRTVVHVSARRPEAADELRDLGATSVVPWGVAVEGAVVVNATPIGMGGDLLPAGIVEAAAGYLEMVYAPELTPAVVRAETIGIPVGWGIDMLVGQAAASFARWFGLEPPLAEMTAAAKDSSTP